MNVTIKKITPWWCVVGTNYTYLHKDLVWRNYVYDNDERDGFYDTEEDAESALHQSLLGENCVNN